MFAHWWIVPIGVAAAALPVLIHWLTRPRPVRFPVSTLRFIQGAVHQRQARYRLRDVIVLLLRTAAILLLAAMIARPLLNRRVVAASSEAPADLVRVVLLDCSQSMGARSGGTAHFERARPLAAGELRFRPSMKCNLLLAAASPGGVFDAPTTNLGALREALAKATVRPERLRVQPALNRAAEMFAAGGEGAQVELAIFSDFQRSNWANVDFSVLPKKCRIQLKPITEEEQIPNLALVSVTEVGRAEVGRETELAIQVGNFSSTPRHVRVELTIGPAVLPFEGHCPARTRTTLGGRVAIPGEGWQIGSARLVGNDDPLPADDILPVSVEVLHQPRLALLTRDRTDQAGSAVVALERALTSTYDWSDNAATRVVRIDAADPDLEALRAADVIAIARSGRLSPQTVAVLAALIQRGRGLLFVAADPLDVANLTDLANSLGASVQLPVEFVPRLGERGLGTRFLTSVDRRRPPFAVFGDELGAALRSLEFGAGLISRPTSRGLAEDVRATFSDQSAFLVVTSSGRGRLAILNVDLERSNLTRTPVFVPLLAELVSKELSGGSQSNSAFASGEPLTVSVPVDESRLEDLQIAGPDADEPLAAAARGRLVPTSAGVLWDVAAAGPPGVYRVLLDGQIVATAVTSAPEEESDLRTLSPKVFEGRLSGGRNLEFQTGDSRGGDEQDTAWIWLAAGCVLCVLGELCTLKAFHT